MPCVHPSRILVRAGWGHVVASGPTHARTRPRPTSSRACLLSSPPRRRLSDLPASAERPNGHGQDSLAKWLMSNEPDPSRRKPSKPSLSRRLFKDESLPWSKPCRTRFAPSPTGLLHLGSLRTAIYNHLLAKKSGGQFILRIEDTDQKRTVPGAQQKICEDLKWAGLQWDEGPDVGGPHAPYNQSERKQIYYDAAMRLVETGHAYRCFCDPEQATASASHDISPIAQIGGCHQNCATLEPAKVTQLSHDGQPWAVRFIHSGPSPEWRDLVYGKQAADRPLPIEGRILLKTDGMPTYHLANVVDDHAMGITHVIRGTEWMSSTALHVALYNAFGWTPPHFSHVGLLTTTDGAKLSKRNFDTDVRSFAAESGVLPVSLVNFLVTMGWRNPTQDDQMDMEQMVEKFDMRFSKGEAIVSLEKLWFLQRKHCGSIFEMASRSPESDHLLAPLIAIIKSDARIKSMGANPVGMIGNRSLDTFIKTLMMVPGHHGWRHIRAVIENVSIFGDLQDVEPLPPAFRSIAAEFLDDPVVVKTLGRLWADEHPATYHGLWIMRGELINAWNHAMREIIAKYCSDSSAIEDTKSPGSDNETVRLPGTEKEAYNAIMRAFGLRLALRKGRAVAPGTMGLFFVLGYEEGKRRLLG